VKQPGNNELERIRQVKRARRPVPRAFTAHALGLAALVLASLAFNPGAAHARGGEAKENAGIYNRANEYFAAKDYRNALKLYRELVERGVENASLYFNLGNTYFKAGDLGYAVLYYEKSLALAPFDRDIRANLGYARRSLKERVRPLYNERLYAFFRSFSALLKPGAIAYIELFFFLLSVGVANLAFFMPYARSKLKRPLYTCLALFALSAFSLLWYAGYEKNHPRGIVVEKQVLVLGAPIAESEALFTLYEGTEMRVREARGDWARVSVADGREGWVLAQNIRFI
jgi:tetratricopeptide (TPR) repeat protein